MHRKVDLNSDLRDINVKYFDIIRKSKDITLKEAIKVSNALVNDIIDLADRHGLALLLGFSGGKESTALLILVTEIMRKLGKDDILKVFYIEVTGNTHEENKRYVYNIIRKVGISSSNFIYLREERDFYDTIKKWGFPSFRRRWCMNVFKRRVLKRYIRDLGRRVLVLIGDRLSDSLRRKGIISKKGIVEYNKSWGQYTVHPIAHWSVTHVLQYLKLSKVKLNPLYCKIGTSGNCVYCPFITDIEYYENLRKYYPEWYKKIIKAETTMKYGGGALFVANRVYRLYDILELGKINQDDIRILRYKKKLDISKCLDTNTKVISA